LYFARFSFVHIGGPPIRSAFLESQPTHGTQQLSGQTLKDHGEEIAAAKTLRDKDARLLSIDRITIAIEGLAKSVKARERQDAWLRIYMYLTAPLIVWLTIKAIDVQSYLNGHQQAAFDRFFNTLHTWIPFAIYTVVVTAIAVSFKQDIMTTFGLSGKADEK
jgi:hypothetical protein